MMFTAFLLLMICAYLPLLTSGFLYHDDFASVFWKHDNISALWRNLTAHPLAVNSMKAGRWGAYLLVPLGQYWLNAHNSPYIRFIGVVLLSVYASINYYWFGKLRYPPMASFTLTISLATLPPFQADIFNTTCESILLATILAQLGTIGLVKAMEAEHCRIMAFVKPMILLLMAQFTYTLGGFYLLVFLMIYMLAPATELSEQLINRYKKILGCFFVILILFYVEFSLYNFITKMLNHKHPSIDTLDRSPALNHDVIGQIGFYFTDILPRSLNFWHIDSRYHPLSGLSLFISLFVFISSVAGVRELLALKFVPIEQNRARLLKYSIIILLFILPLSIAPTLMAVPGRFVPFRTLQSSMGMFFILAFWGVAYNASRLINRLRYAEEIRQYACLIVIVISIACCNLMLERDIVRPANMEHDYILNTLSGIHPSDSYINRPPA